METPILLFILIALVIAGFLTFLYRRLRTTRRQNHHLQVQVEQASHELQQLHTELKTSKEAADEAEHARSAFLADMIHELRTHLNIVLGYTQIVHREHRLSRRQRKAIDVIHRHSEHLVMLLSEILDLSQLEAHEIRLKPTNFNLRRFLSGIAEVYRTQAEQGGLTFTTDFANDLPRRVHADERRLRQVLLTLLNNAVKFTNRGGIIFRASICDKSSSSPTSGLPTHRLTYHLRFHVEDTGIGIPAEHLHDIFLPFHLVRKTSLHKGGIRLGLAISQQLVRLMGGELQVTSTFRRGTTFWFELPLLEAFEDDMSDTGAVQTIVGFKGALKKLLIADDRYENRVVLKEMLLPLGFGIIEAVDGFDVLAKAAQHRPELILMDLTMPVLNGFDAIRHIRQMPAISDVVVVGMSASVLRQIQEENYTAGGDDFLVKPIRLDDLLECLQRHLKLEWIYAEQTNRPEDDSEEK